MLKAKLIKRNLKIKKEICHKYQKVRAKNKKSIIIIFNNYLI